MKKTMVMLLLLVSGLVMAKPVGIINFYNGGLLTLDNEATHCKEVSPEAKDATYTYPNGRVIKGCWTYTPRGIFIQDDEGDVALFPPTAVQRLAEV